MKFKFKAKKLKSNINQQGLNIATYGQAYKTLSKYPVYAKFYSLKNHPANLPDFHNVTYQRS